MFPNNPRVTRGSQSKRTFNDYVDIFFSIFDHLHNVTWTFLTLNMDKNRHFWTTYPPLLVCVVIEGPQTCNCLPFHHYSIILNTTHFYHNCVQKTKNVSLFPFLLRIFCFLDKIELKRNEQLGIFEQWWN